MAKPHVALLVEDEDDFAVELIDLLRSIGHDHLRAKNQSQALAIVEKGGFCYALVDLQIKVDERSPAAIAEAGQSLIQRIREKFPGRDGRDEHYLPLFAMSAYSKHAAAVVKAIRTGKATDFIEKPLSANKTEPLQTILEWLKKTGREDHSDCEALNRAARGAPEVAPAQPTRSLAKVTSLLVRRATRELVVDGETLDFKNAPARFTDLVGLAVAVRKRPNGGFVNLSKPAREKLRAALNKRRAGLADQILEAPRQLGVRLRVRPELE